MEPISTSPSHGERAIPHRRCLRGGRLTAGGYPCTGAYQPDLRIKSQTNRAIGASPSLNSDFRGVEGE